MWINYLSGEAVWEQNQFLVFVEASTFSRLKRFQPSGGPCTRRLFAQHDCLFPKHPQPALFMKT